MSNSSLVSCTIWSPNCNAPRQHKIDRITPHCVVGQCSIEALGNLFANPGRGASSNYGIGCDGRVGLFVDEGNRSWCTSSPANDHRAITIECASDNYHPFAFNAVVYERLVELCTDICRRNGKNKLLWLGHANYEPAANEMLLTVHRWFDDTICPGDWLMARMGDLAARVTKNLGGGGGSQGGANWLPPVTGYDADDFNNGYAGNGYPGQQGKATPICLVAIDDPQVVYRAKERDTQHWLPWVYGKDYNPKDLVKGCAGNPGMVIDEIEYYMLDGSEMLGDAADIVQGRWLPPVVCRAKVTDTIGNPGHACGAVAFKSKTLRKYCVATI